MERVLLKVSGIVAIILGIFYSITIIGAIVGIPLIIGGTKMAEYAGLSDEDVISKKESILGWSIFFLFFTFIGGILGLIFYFTMDGNKIFTKKSDYIEEIKKLDELKKQGVISEEEYEAKKKQILGI